MKHIISVFFLINLVCDTCFAIGELDEGCGLRYRRNASTLQQPVPEQIHIAEEQQPLLTKPETQVPYADQMKKEDVNIDLDDIFSPLEQTWTDFKTNKFEICYMQIRHLQDKNNPEGHYLMGLMYENGYHYNRDLRGATKWYTLALVYTEKNSDLYHLAAQGLDRCKEEREKYVKDLHALCH